mmetsp:Transcript_40273/g.90318  ORF Transcript_40273/g.90318 Transcript_40273/m.90318 type:complete len:94 (+) Transcript_40273:826-1107(+)
MWMGFTQTMGSAMLGQQALAMAESLTSELTFTQQALRGRSSLKVLPMQFVNPRLTLELLQALGTFVNSSSAWRSCAHTCFDWQQKHARQWFAV